MFLRVARDLRRYSDAAHGGRLVGCAAVTEPRPFVVYALPRSKTLWMSKYLTYGDIECHHDTSRWMRSVEDVRSWLSQERVGTVETAAVPWWRLIRHLQPDTRVMTIRRPPEEVIESLMRIDMRGDPALDRADIERRVKRLDACLDRIEREYPDCLSMPYWALSTSTGCRLIFEQLLPYKFDYDWWTSIRDIHVSGNVPALSRYFRANEPQINRAIRQVGAYMRGQAWERHVSDGNSDIVIRDEPFETYLRDGRELFAAHCQAVGEAPEEFLNKNIPLGREAHAAGNMQILSARCNGRMFGYHVSLIGPSMEAVARISATEIASFTSPEMSGLGIKLKAEALRRLGARGVHEALLWSSARGEGQRLKSLHRRLGGLPIGEFHRVTLRAG